MAEEKKKGFLRKLFGGNPGCCSIQLEEVENPDQLESGQKPTTTQRGSYSTDSAPKRFDTDDSKSD